MKREKIINVMCIFVLFFIFLNVNAQNFRTQGEQETYWAKQIFKKEYTKQQHPRYTGRIIQVDDTTFLFGVRRLEVYSFIGEDYKQVFSLGILYPDLFSGNCRIISFFEELNFSKEYTVKRLKLLAFHEISGQILINPTVYFIELTNPNATETTDLKTFIKGASLTFIKQGWLRI